MNPEYYFQKGLRLIVASAVIFALIVLFSAMVSRGFPLWLALVLLVPAGLGVVGFYFFSVGSSADLSERFFRRFGCSQPRGEEKTTTEGVGSEQRCERSPDAIVPESAVVSADPVPDGFSKMHSPPSTNIPIRIWAMPLTGRIGKFCDDVCFIWHVWRLFRMMCRRFGFGMIG
jgi:hypothetical protein